MGGALFHWLDIPLAWMLGPMVFNIAASVGRLPVSTPPALRTHLLPVLGVYLGGSFTPQTFERAGDWPLSLLAVIVFTLACTAVVAWYYRRLARFDGITALFSAGPGAMTSMIMTGAALGGDERRIALAQTLRITMLVLALPPLIFALNPAVSQAGALAPVQREFDAVECLMLVAAAWGSIFLLRSLRVPSPEIAGPMIASAVLFASGAVAVPLPGWLLEATLWIIGTTIGCRFAGVRLRLLWTSATAAAGAVGLSLALAAAFAALVATLLPGVDFVPALLAMAPGGVAEMCLVAVALDIDPSFVAFHHFSRMFLLMLLTPLAGRVLARAAEG